MLQANETGKKCSDCHQWKPFSGFYKKKDTRDGYQSQCRECRTLYLIKRGDRKPPTEAKSIEGYVPIPTESPIEETKTNEPESLETILGEFSARFERTRNAYQIEINLWLEQIAQLKSKVADYERKCSQIDLILGRVSTNEPPLVPAIKAASPAKIKLLTTTTPTRYRVAFAGRNWSEWTELDQPVKINEARFAQVFVAEKVYPCDTCHNEIKRSELIFAEYMTWRNGKTDVKYMCKFDATLDTEVS